MFPNIGVGPPKSSIKKKASSIFTIQFAVAIPLFLAQHQYGLIEFWNLPNTPCFPGSPRPIIATSTTSSTAAGSTPPMALGSLASWPNNKNTVLGSQLMSRMPTDMELCMLPSCHSGYSSVGRASDCRNQMVPGSIPGGRIVLVG